MNNAATISSPDISVNNPMFMDPDVCNTDACSALFEKLKIAGDGDPQPLPDNLVRQIGRAILRRAVDEPGV